MEERNRDHAPHPQDTGAHATNIISEYVVEEKDTLPEIARRYGLTVEELMAANQEMLPNEVDLVQPGQRINIPHKSKGH